MFIIYCSLLCLVSVILLFVAVIRKRNMHIWLPAYVKQSMSGRKTTDDTVHIYLAITDHYEPFYGNADRNTAMQRVKVWAEKYPRIAAKHQDIYGKVPRHSFFYPIEEYDKEVMDVIADICGKGFGDVEIHLHHDNDNSENLRNTLNDFKNLLFEKHGLLRKENGTIVYGFIHGNWALDNSRPDGKWCGVNDELTILKETGCYADFTMPSAPDVTQSKIVNTVYFAPDDPNRPKSYDKGIPVKEGYWNDRDLLLIPGPLGINWSYRKWGIIPRIEIAELSHDNIVVHERIDFWVKNGVSIAGKENHRFIKLHTHGAQAQNTDLLLNGELEKIWLYLEKNYNDGKKFSLHYVTAYEMYEMIKKLAHNEA